MGFNNKKEWFVRYRQIKSLSAVILYHKMPVLFEETVLYARNIEAN